MANAASTVYYMESANLFCGDHDPTLSKHLSLEELQLPTLEGDYADHSAGGSPVSIDVMVGVKKLEPSFKLKGFDMDLLTQFGLASHKRYTFTAYGVLRDLRTSEAKEGKVIMQGRLGKVAPDAFKRGDLMGAEYAINEVVHYEVHGDGKELIYWDFFTAEWRSGGASQNSQERAILRLPA